MTDYMALAQENLKNRLADNPYPGRGLILGIDETGEKMAQVYWIMGRSPNSRNRIFEHDDERVWTKAADPAKVKDPSLIIYNAVDELSGRWVVTNGDQTDTICRAIISGATFEQALGTREYEPDGPNFTPRISGMFDITSGRLIAKIGVLRKCVSGEATDRCFWNFEGFAPALGYCVTTYMADGNPLPPFVGDPYLLPLDGDCDGIAKSIWDNLDEDNRVSLAVKLVDLSTGENEITIINKYEAVETDDSE